MVIRQRQPDHQVQTVPSSHAAKDTPHHRVAVPPVFRSVAVPPEPLRGGRTADSEEKEDDEVELSWDFLKSAPPWLVSFVAHMTMLVILALILVPIRRDTSVKISAIFAEDIGQQLDEEALKLSTSPLLELENQLITPEDLPPVDEPLAAPPNLDISPQASTATSQQDAPMIGLALTGREKGLKQALLAAYGGTALTEEAVLRGLRWLKRNQNRDGSWSLVGPYQDGGQVENKIAATSMALLAFQGQGNTHADGMFKAQVSRGWNWLRKRQDKHGDFWISGRGAHNHRLYSQAQATIAVCELYGMSHDKALRQPAQQALNYAVRVQGRHGGWRYRPGGESDTSVTGWFIMALQSGMMAGLEVPSPTLDRISTYLDSVSSENGSLYCYRPGRKPTATMTAEALLCRQYLGWSRDDPRLLAGVQHLLANPINWHDQNVYYWYYATQVAHHMEGDVWDEWNARLRQIVPENQVTSGKEAGSWSSNDDQWGMFGGRLYVSCLCIYMLEVYYRHLPVYSLIYSQGGT